ncbi:unnamed protein product [Clonostachys rhizophaga]|uniref:Major facilitator superfamily (MFS) profile domain-containing protein n=1 Tax=Clonostachys rhizophaga TaxID=160324 RepID=A0A9N9V1D2_9HYPO|nr:unnamed protein product [Clonostachys rhizophaga]
MAQLPNFSRKTSGSSASLKTLCDASSAQQSWGDSEKGLSELEDEIRAIKQAERASTSTGSSLSDWTTLLGGFLSLVATGGIGNATGLVQTYWENNQLRDFSSRDIGWIAGTNICLSLFLPVLSGPVYDRYGPLWLMVGGSASFVVGVFVMSFLNSPELPQMTYGLLLLTWGIMGGAGNGLVATAVSGAVCQRFDKRRGLANGIASGGNSVGGVVWPMMLRETLNRWGWQWAVRLVGGIALVLVALGCVLVRPPPQMVVTAKREAEIKKAEGRKEAKAKVLKRCVVEGAECFKKADFVWMTTSLAIFQFTVMGVAGTLPSWGEGQGFDQTSLFNLVAVMNAAAAVGRIAVGALSDTIGRFNTCVSIMTLSVVVMFGLFFNVGGMIWKFYVFAAFWGFVYGAVLMMISVLVREQCNHEEFGRYLSACHVALSIAGLVCVPLSAQMLASFGPQMDVVFFGSLCTVSLLFMILTRWAFLDYKWSWTSKV